MNRTRVLTALVLADIVTAFSTIGSELFFGWTLPSGLQDYAMTQNLAIFSGKGLFLFPLWALTIGSTMVAWIGLLNLWWFARRLYVVAWIAWLALLLFSGPSVATPLGAMFSAMEGVIGGAILGLVYFTELSRHFERSAVQVQAAA